MNTPTGGAKSRPVMRQVVTAALPPFHTSHVRESIPLILGEAYIASHRGNQEDRASRNSSYRNDGEAICHGG